MQSAVALLLALFLFSCKDKSPAVVSDAVSGGASEILVIMNKNKWESPVGDTLKAHFRQAQIGLPQPEPMFDLLNVPESFFDGIRKKHRNLLYVKISPEVEKSSITLKDSPWAKTQKYFRIEVPSDSAFITLFNANKEKISYTFLRAEQQRLSKFYKQQKDVKICTLLKDKYKLNLSVPLQYRVNKQIEDFIWISRETKIDSKGVVYFQKPYTDKKQFEVDAILATLSEQLKYNIPGPSAGSYMGIDTITPMSSEYYQYADKHYAVTIRGLWTVVHDFMGGPFIANVILDEKKSRVIYLMGYVYAPEDTKRDMARQVEGILNTLNLE
ncbi:DUF4837 family protein [Odoribacter sp. OttesenSCG-928-J03]|nr:DUF4837 family protein [Odoribacter sp. OttesenSCG-928-J03]MDL2283126.1 DUF4837 family protein [Odoribacter sp. OttesenSCG-928-G04]MDL2330483.1 DUF4837 family protein [Odoribacter sp. OttesenSCG-928-A06]